MGQFGAEHESGTVKAIVADLRKLISEGTYKPGDKVPSTRALAQEIGVSRTTVTAAYEQLLSEGYLSSRQGATTVVAEIRTKEKTPRGLEPQDQSQRLSMYAQRLSCLPNPAPYNSKLLYDFRYGPIAASDFPKLVWKRATTNALLRTPRRLTYDHPAGSANLRKELQGYLWRARGLQCEADQIVLVSGSQQGLDLCARVLIDPGDDVVVEDPGYLMAKNAFVATGASLLPVPCDAHGLVVAKIPRDRRAALAFVTPSHQYPLGGILSAARRQALLDWAEVEQAHIIEDDYDGEYRYDVKPIPPLFRSASRRVIYLGTVSKSLSPTLRVGYLVLPHALVETFTRAKQVTDRHSSTLEQEALSDLIGSGAYERHIRRMRRANGQRRSILLNALQAAFGDRIEIVGSSAGLHIVAWFNGTTAEDESRLVAAALKEGIGIYPIGPLFVSDAPRRAGLVFGYASMQPDQLQAGVRQLGEILR